MFWLAKNCRLQYDGLDAFSRDGRMTHRDRMSQRQGGWLLTELGVLLLSPPLPGSESSLVSAVREAS